jgi:hypothetical protein
MPKLGWTQMDRTLQEQNNAPSWRDCNAAGLKHQWRLSHTLADGVTYWLCRRGSCAVGTRTLSPYDRPKGVLQDG